MSEFGPIERFSFLRHYNSGIAGAIVCVGLFVYWCFFAEPPPGLKGQPWWALVWAVLSWGGGR